MLLKTEEMAAFSCILSVDLDYILLDLDPEPILGMFGMKQEYTWDGMPVHYRVPFSHKHFYTYLG